MTIVYGSVCSGIEAASVAWEPLGWKPAFFSEIEPFPSTVLATRFGSNMPGEPLSKNGVPNHGDFTKIDADAGPVDLLVGGTPCQSFSVAGKRLGLDDPRGNLALEYLALARRLRARWIVWENVPGVLSSRSGNGRAAGDDAEGPADGGGETPSASDFATFLAFVRECGYGFAYRILDAQHVRVSGYERAVPQRRRRLFLVGYLGDWRPAAAVLFEPDGVPGHPAPRRTARQGAAGYAESSFGDFREDFAAGTLKRSGGGSETFLINRDVAHARRGEGFDASEDGTGRGTPPVPVRTGYQGGNNGGGAGAILVVTQDSTPAVDFSGDVPIAFPWQQGGSMSMPVDVDGSVGTLVKNQSYAVAIHDVPGPLHTALNTAAGDGNETRLVGVNMQGGKGQAGETAPAVAVADGGQWIVRRLTPRECERLQGFPDDWTRIPWRGKPAEDCPDGPRYSALGNSMAVNVMRWLGERIDLFEELKGSGAFE